MSLSSPGIILVFDLPFDSVLVDTHFFYSYESGIHRYISFIHVYNSQKKSTFKCAKIVGLSITSLHEMELLVSLFCGHIFSRCIREEKCILTCINQRSSVCLVTVVYNLPTDKLLAS